MHADPCVLCGCERSLYRSDCPACTARLQLAAERAARSAGALAAAVDALRAIEREHGRDVAERVREQGAMQRGR